MRYCQHYAAHDGPDTTREYFTAVVDTWNLFDTYLPTTEAQVPLSASLPLLTSLTV
jgi:beta-glucosidase-like glycosyl hydrolase